MRPTETNREIGEAVRQAITATRSAGSYARGVQKAAPTQAGTTTGGEWVPYGRVGVTALSDGFRVRGTQRYGRVGVTPVKDGFRVRGT